jgi:hypothetical protein
MKYQAGEIYFVREHDRDGELTHFVKIGLVKSPRTSEDRLIEHQTGNPRRLVIPEGHIVFTEAVSLVEAQLHRRFATDRIGGEWFNFSDPNKLDAAIAASKALAVEVGLATPLLLQADALESQASNQTMVPATEFAMEQARKYGYAKEQEKATKALNSELKGLLTIAADAGQDLGTVATRQSKTFKAKFDEAAFLKDYWDVAQKYFVEKAEWSQRFISKYKLPKDFAFEEDFSAQLDEIRHLIPQGAAKVSAIDLEEPILRLTQLEAIVDWDLKLSKAKLKIECGLNEGIEGVCTWKREATIKSSFDSNKLFESDFDLYSQYVLDETTKQYLIPSKGSKRK